MSVLSMPMTLLAANKKLPSRVYCNKDIQVPLVAALTECMAQGVLGEITSWDGCFVIRSIRGSSSPSKHGWGYAVDMNAKDNPMGYTYSQLVKLGLKPFSEKFLSCWRKHGFTCGGDWVNRPDRMHFEL